MVEVTATDGSISVPPVDVVRERLTEIRQRIEGAGGGEDTVTVVAMTKAFPVDYVEVAIKAGLTDIGENYAQELGAKHGQAMALGLEARWHFVGGLQRNKVKLVAPAVSLWHTVDRSSLVSEIAKRAPGARILIQVNTTAEPQKSGCEPNEAHALVDQARELGLAVEGLMTIGPTGGGDPRPAFDDLRALGASCEVRELSMGMSADFEAAVACGSTMVRIGTALFGPRPPR